MTEGVDPRGETATIRQATGADAAGIARVHVDTWRTTYPGIIPDHVIAGMTYERREQFWQRVLAQSDTRHVCLVAEDEAGEIVGFATGGPERAGAYPFAGEIYSIYIRAENQGQGLGRRLMQAAAEQLARQGVPSVMVWVAAANPFRRFYEALGGQEVDRKQEEMGGQLIEEVAYGWPDIDILNPQQTEASDEDSFAGVIGLFDGPTEIDHNDIYRGDPENPR